MRILIIEDDITLCDALSHHLKKEGHTADICHNGGEALHFILQQAHQLIILDRMLPEKNGIDILKEMRSMDIHTPVIITTALDGIGDRITGLDAGADDYLVKPFSVEELMARIRAVSRRPGTLDIDNRIQHKDLSLDLTSLRLQGPTASHTLSKKESNLMEIFLQNSDQILPRRVLLARVWGPDAPVEDGNLDNYIHFLRRRLKTVGSTAQIRTVRSVGYVLEQGKKD